MKKSIITMKDEIFKIITERDILNCLDMCENDKDNIDKTYLSYNYIKIIDKLFQFLDDRQEKEFRLLYDKITNSQMPENLGIEQDCIYKLAQEFHDSTKQTYNDYCRFYNQKITPILNNFTELTKEKLEPNNMREFFQYRLDKSIDWSESENNIGIDFFSACDEEYFNSGKTIEDMRNQVRSYNWDEI